MEPLIVTNRVQLDNKYSAIFCDNKYIYLINKNRKFLNLYTHNLDFVEQMDIFLDYDSICYDTTENFFYAIKISSITEIYKMDKQFNIISNKALKLNNQPKSVSYCEETKAIFLYTENSILEFDTEYLKLKKIINPQKEEYSPIVNNNFDFNLWEKRYNLVLNVNEKFRIIDIASFDNKSIFILNFVNETFFIYKLTRNTTDIDKLSNLNVELENFDYTLDLMPSLLEALPRGNYWDNRIKEDDFIDEQFNKDYKENILKDDLSNFRKGDCENTVHHTVDCKDSPHKNDKHCKCKKEKCKDCTCFDWNKKQDCHNKHNCHEPECKPDCYNLDDSCCEIIHSVALIELSISHILNSEGEKIQKVVKCSNSICEILETNNSVIEVIEKVTRLEEVLCTKLKTVKDICNSNNCKKI